MPESADLIPLAFSNPDPGWVRFDAPSMRVLLTLLAQMLKSGGRELQVVTVANNHASVLVVADRTPMEITQLNLRYYAGMRRFLREGLFALSTTAQLEGLGARWEATIEYADTLSGQGFSLRLRQVGTLEETTTESH